MSPMQDPEPEGIRKGNFGGNLGEDLGGNLGGNPGGIWEGIHRESIGNYPRGHEEQLGLHVGGEPARQEFAGSPGLQELQDTWAGTRNGILVGKGLKRIRVRFLGIAEEQEELP